MSGYPLDKDALTQLEGSLKTIGQIYSVVACAQHKDRILAGKHRLEKGAKNIYYLDVDERANALGVTHAVAEWMVLINSNVQRNVSKEERMHEIRSLAQVLMVDGVPKDKIAARLLQLVPFGKSWIYELAPEFTNQAKSQAIKKGLEKKKYAERTIPVPKPLTSEQVQEAVDIVASDLKEAIAKIDEEEGRKPKPEPYAKGLSPSLKQNNPSEYTKPHTAFLMDLDREHVHYKSEKYIPVDKWTCSTCRDIRTELPEDDDKCVKGHWAWERVQLKVDTLVEIAGKQIAIEAEGEGTASDDPERDALLNEQDIEVLHCPNEFLKKWGWLLAQLIKIVS